MVKLESLGQIGPHREMMSQDIQQVGEGVTGGRELLKGRALQQDGRVGSRRVGGLGRKGVIGGDVQGWWVGLEEDRMRGGRKRPEIETIIDNEDRSLLAQIKELGELFLRGLARTGNGRNVPARDVIDEARQELRVHWVGESDEVNVQFESVAADDLGDALVGRGHIRGPRRRRRRGRGGRRGGRRGSGVF
jgi:hypothetical protein